MTDFIEKILGGGRRTAVPPRPAAPRPAALPPLPPIKPTEDDTARVEQARRQKTIASARKGRKATILSGLSGDTAPAQVRRPVLGSAGGSLG